MEIAGYLFMYWFPHPEDGFLIFYANSLSCAVYSFRSCWKWIGGIWGSLVVLISSYDLCPLCATHSCACAVLSCAYQQELQQGCFSRAALSHLAPLLQPHFVLSHGVLISTILVYYQQSLVGSRAIQLSVFETYTLALLSSGNRMLSETYFGLWFIGLLESGLQYALAPYN